eukprot:694181_1
MLAARDGGAHADDSGDCESFDSEPETEQKAAPLHQSKVPAHAPEIPQVGVCLPDPAISARERRELRLRHARAVSGGDAARAQLCRFRQTVGISEEPQSWRFRGFSAEI